MMRRSVAARLMRERLASSDVVVCGSCGGVSQFTQVTVAPTGTLSESGRKAKPRIAMM